SAHHAEEDLSARQRGDPDATEQRRDHERDAGQRQPLQQGPRRRAGRPVGVLRHPLAQARHARRRSPAIGDALTLPPPECSTRTAIATLGSSYGAKPMNHECGCWFGPSSAVPDLPATTMLLSAAPKVKNRPIWPFTASRIAAAI